MNYEVFGLNQLKLYISQEHRFGTDSMLLGEFAQDFKIGKNALSLVDLCSGCGIIPVMLASRALEKKPIITPKIYAVEICEEAVNLMKKTAKENELDFLEIIQGDLREEITLSKIGRESADLVTINPPYYPLNSGFERSSGAQKTARYEKFCSLEQAINAAAYLLKFGGVLKMCMVAERLIDCAYFMRKANVEPKEIVFIPYNNRKGARLMLIGGKKGAKAGARISFKSEL